MTALTEDDHTRAMLGIETDHTIARKVGVPPSEVAAARKALGVRAVPSHLPHRDFIPAIVSRLLATVPDQEIVAGFRLSRNALRDFRAVKEINEPKTMVPAKGPRPDRATKHHRELLKHALDTFLKKYWDIDGAVLGAIRLETGIPSFYTNGINAEQRAYLLRNGTAATMDAFEVPEAWLNTALAAEKRAKAART